MRNLLRRFGIVFLLFALLIPVATHAQFVENIRAGVQRASEPSGINQTASLESMIGNVINIVLGLVGVILLGIIIYGGFLYMTAGGNAKQTQDARAWILNAMIGLIIVVASYAIADFVLEQLVEVQSGGGVASDSPTN